MFAKDGFNGVSVRTIARAVGITEGSIYNHFTSKEEIMEEILARHAKELERAMPTGQALIDAYHNEDWKPAWAIRVKMMEQSCENVDLNIIRILMNEQYRVEKAREIVMKYYIEEPVKITYDLLKHIEQEGEELPSDAMTLARAYQYPIFCMMQEYELVLSMGGDTASVLNKIKAHVEFFWKVIVKRNYDL